MMLSAVSAASDASNDAAREHEDYESMDLPTLLQTIASIDLSSYDRTVLYNKKTPKRYNKVSNPQPDEERKKEACQHAKKYVERNKEEVKLMDGLSKKLEAIVDRMEVLLEEFQFEKVEAILKHGILEIQKILKKNGAKLNTQKLEDHFKKYQESFGQIMLVEEQPGDSNPHEAILNGLREQMEELEKMKNCKSRSAFCSGKWRLNYKIEAERLRKKSWNLWKEIETMKVQAVELQKKVKELKNEVYKNLFIDYQHLYTALADHISPSDKQKIEEIVQFFLSDSLQPSNGTSAWAQIPIPAMSANSASKRKRRQMEDKQEEGSVRKFRQNRTNSYAKWKLIKNDGHGMCVGEYLEQQLKKEEEQAEAAKNTKDGLGDQGPTTSGDVAPPNASSFTISNLLMPTPLTFSSSTTSSPPMPQCSPYLTQHFMSFGASSGTLLNRELALGSSRGPSSKTPSTDMSSPALSSVGIASSLSLASLSSPAPSCTSLSTPLTLTSPAPQSSLDLLQQNMNFGVSSGVTSNSFFWWNSPLFQEAPGSTSSSFLNTTSAVIAHPADITQAKDDGITPPAQFSSAPVSAPARLSTSNFSISALLRQDDSAPIVSAGNPVTNVSSSTDPTPNGMIPLLNPCFHPSLLCYYPQLASGLADQQQSLAALSNNNISSFQK